MDEVTRQVVLVAAEKLFDRDTLYKLACSVGEARKRKSLRFWQEQLLAQLSEQVGIDVNSHTQLVAIFTGTAEKYVTFQALAEQEEVEKLKQQARAELKKITKTLRDKRRSHVRINPPGVPQAPLNRNAELIKFDVTFSLEWLAGSRLSEFQPDPQDKLNLHNCCELIRAQHLGATVPGSQLVLHINASIDGAIKYFEAGNTRIDGWYNQLSDGLFLGAWCGLDDKLVALCKWANPRRKREYQGVLDDEVQDLHLVMAGLFQPEFASGFRHKLAKCMECRKVRIRHLAGIIDAIVRKDQEAFGTCTRQAIENYRKRKAPEPNSLLLAEWLPVHATTAYHVGLRVGMTPCHFPEGVSAYLCRPYRESEFAAK